MAKILVVEDMKPIQILLEKRLKKEKHEVIVVNNGKEALAEVLSQDDIDLIFLDIMMPGMGGIEFLEGHFSECRSREIKVCMLTALEDNENIQKCLALGASDYLVKPIDNELLLEKVETLLNDSANARFAAIKTKISVNLTQEDECFDGNMIVLSENKAIIQSSKEFQTAEIVHLASESLSEFMGSEFSVMTRVVSKKEERESFAYLMEFVGLAEEKVSKIRGLTVLGKEINLNSELDEESKNSDMNKDEQ